MVEETCIEFNRKFSNFKKREKSRRKRNKDMLSTCKTSISEPVNKGYEKKPLSCTQRVTTKEREFLEEKTSKTTSGEDYTTSDYDALAELSHELSEVTKDRNQIEKMMAINRKENRPANKGQMLYSERTTLSRLSIENTPRHNPNNFKKNKNITKTKESSKTPLHERSKCSIADSSFHLKTMQKEDLSVHHAKANQTILKLQKEISQLKKEKMIREKQYGPTKRDDQNTTKEDKVIEEIGRDFENLKKARESQVQRKIVY